jgi:hypothetical protein
MFRLFFLVVAAALVYAEGWTHYTRQNEVRDVVRTENGTLWAAFAWGLQERLTNKTENTYMPGSNNLEAVDFVQLFDLPGGDIIAASKNGILVRRNKNFKNFETVNNSFTEKKRNLLRGLGKRAENILILPFEGAIAFFDYEQKRSVITITQIGTSSLERHAIKKIFVENDSIWVDLENIVWKRRIDWANIYDDRFLADPNSWEIANKSLEEDKKLSYVPSNLNFPLEKVKTISLISGGDAFAWGNDFDLISRMQNGQWAEPFRANQNSSNYGDDQKNYLTKSMAVMPDGSLAVGIWGPGLIAYDSRNFPAGWWHSTNSNNICPTMFSNRVNDGWTIVQGVAASPDLSGFLFSYVSEANYGLGFVDNNGKARCVKNPEASSPVAFHIIARKSETGEWEIFVAWRNALESRSGGIDFYSLNPPQSSENFYPSLKKKWPLSFGSPIDFAFDSRGVIWAVSESKIFYLSQKDDEWKEPSYIRGFGGGIISALETDAQNGLWVGTLGYGAYSFSQINNSPDSLVAKQYKIKDGLLNETVYDIAIDTIKGKVYFAHDLGLSVYSTALVRSASDYMQNGSPKPIAYPNPFRPGRSDHGFITIDYISEKSSVYILDSSGKRVRLFRGEDLRGGAVVWDGRNESGKLVAPGLYHYLAADGKNTAKGKIIIER